MAAATARLPRMMPAKGPGWDSTSLCVLERSSPLLPEEGEGDGVVVGVAGEVGVAVGEVELDGVWEGVSEGVALAVGEAVGVSDELVLGVGVPDGVTDMEGVTDGVALAVGDTDGLTLGVAVLEGVGDGVAEGGGTMLTGPAELGSSPSPMECVEACPSCPFSPFPQQNSSPRSNEAQTCDEPADTATAECPAARETGPATNGCSLSPILSRLPYPRRPSKPEPQHSKSPLSRMAQVKKAPAVTCTTLRPAPTCTGLTVLGSSLSPMVVVRLYPSSPRELEPQHSSSPVLSTAQLCAPPAAMPTAVLPEPRDTVPTV